MPGPGPDAWLIIPTFGLLLGLRPAAAATAARSAQADQADQGPHHLKGDRQAAEKLDGLGAGPKRLKGCLESADSFSAALPKRHRQHPQIEHQMAANPDRGGQAWTITRLGNRGKAASGQLPPPWDQFEWLTMKVIVDLCVVPIGGGVHLAPFIAACERVLKSAGLKIQLHANGTAIEGEWGPVFSAIEACHQTVHAMDCPRIYTSVRINTRTDKDQSLEDKVASVEALL